MKAAPESNAILRRLQRLPDNVRQFAQTIILSMAAGMSAVGFLFMVNLFFSLTYVQFASHSKLFFAIASLLLILGTSILVGFLLNVFSPDAAGSGIPQVKVAYWEELGQMEPRAVVVKFMAGVLSTGGGSSLGAGNLYPET